jgi:hypothetical protein
MIFGVQRLTFIYLDNLPSLVSFQKDIGVSKGQGASVDLLGIFTAHRSYDLRRCTKSVFERRNDDWTLLPLAATVQEEPSEE